MSTHDDFMFDPRVFEFNQAMAISSSFCHGYLFLQIYTIKTTRILHFSRNPLFFEF